MSECDFCSSKNVVRNFQCRDFDSSSLGAGVLYKETNVVLHSVNFWAACEECARYVLNQDIDGLLAHVIEALHVRETMNDQQKFSFIRHLNHTYELFFANWIHVKE